MRHRMHCRLAPLGVAVVAWMPGAFADAPRTSPYAGQESREIKALSQQEVESLLAGRGMGFARTAELNGYPGPAHVLELGDALGLTVEQRERTQALFDAMEREAVSLGKELVEAERGLDRLFANRVATPETLAPALARVGELHARLRGAHLRAHIAQTAILTAEQAERYADLRGYAAARRDGGGHGHGRGHPDRQRGQGH